jgi:hypothetical protein
LLTRRAAARPAGAALDTAPAPAQAWPIGGAHGNVERAVGHQAIVTAVEDVGMTFIDTAEAYELEMQGGSETLIVSCQCHASQPASQPAL